MLERMNRTPERMLMTVDAVGGVWRYAMTLGRRLSAEGVEIAFLCFGPRPDSAQSREAEEIGALVARDLPLDWTARKQSELDRVAAVIGEEAARFEAELVHLNLPSQAAGLKPGLPVVAVAHSCVPSWFHAVRGSEPPAGWAWHVRLNQRGLQRADAVVVPSRAHADLMAECYGPIDGLAIVPNAVDPEIAPGPKTLPFVLAAGRWWDAGKNAQVLEAAAETTVWPILAAGATRGPDGTEFTFSRVRPLGPRDHATMSGLMARAPIFVSPSVYEPFGLAALEAAQAGAALVLADIPTYRELWDEVALFFPPHAAGACAAAIDLLAEDAERRETLAANARRVAVRFTPDIQAEAMLAAYAAATARARARTVIEV